jgi:hypothetical protein
LGGLAITGLTVAAALLSVLALTLLALTLLALPVLAVSVLAVPLALGATMLRSATFLVTSIHRIHPFLQRFLKGIALAVQRHALRRVPVRSEALFARKDRTAIAGKPFWFPPLFRAFSGHLWTAVAALL